MNPPAHPVHLRLDRSAERFEIDWDDGVRSQYPWSFLRANCPSAGEIEARQAGDPLRVLGKIPSHKIVDVRLVGSYAVNFTFADGHNAGIYTWAYLHGLRDRPEVESAPAQ